MGRLFILPALIACVTSWAQVAAPIRFQPPFFAKFDRGENFIDIKDGNRYGKAASPEFADWNSDGLKDLLVGYMGQTDGGFLNVFINRGTAKEPKFTNGFEAPIYVSGA